MIKILQKFFKFSGPVNEKKFYWSIVLGIVEAFFKALRVPAIYIILRSAFSGEIQTKDIWLSFGILFVGIIGEIAVGGKGKMLQTEAGYDSSCDKRIEIAEHLRYLPMGYFNDNSLGYITSVTTNTMEQMGDVATRVVMLTLGGFLQACLIILSLCVFDYRIGGIAIGGVIVFLLINRLMQIQSNKISPRKIQVDTRLVEEVLEYIQGIAEVKSYRLGLESNKKLEKAIEDNARTNIDMEFTYIPFMAMQNIVTKITGVLMAAFSVKFYLNGTMELYETATMMIGSFLVFSSLEQAGTFSALLRVIDLSVDKGNSILSLPTMDINGKDLQPSTHTIEMKGIDFAYDQKKVIDDVSLVVPEKKTVAFVGPSGGGKTTLCHLMARFWDVDQGEVKLDDVNVKEYSMDSLMKNYSFVFQNVYLFHDTIANNIRFGQPEASMEKVMDAAKKAACHDFIMALPEGYDTVIGEGGASLSGGEKQRISIARAIMKDAPIIILDEATANVDPENEKELVQAVEELTKDKTIVMIAHRLKTVRNADEIFVVDQGKIVQQGSHESLMKEEGIYKNFVEARKEATGWKLTA